MESTQKIDPFTKELWQWFARHKRILPWRDLPVEEDTQRAYLVLVSEIMLQQTQVPRVEVVFKRFVREFPSLQGLAKASNREVILAWRGMGYNSRALRLRDAAKRIVQEFTGEFPKKMEELLSIKGVGHYTAAAIRNFAFDLPTPCLDTNIRRILHRVFVGPEKRDGTWRKKDKALLETAGVALHMVLENSPIRKSNYPITFSHERVRHGEPVEPYERHPFGKLRVTYCPSTSAWHAALMDFGSLMCTKRNPKCDHCPLAKKSLCRSAGRIRLDVRAKRKEPGREIAGKFVPNRIIRGRIVELLRDEERGSTLEVIGAHVCVDWHRKEHEGWLLAILQSLKNDALVSQRRKTYHLNT